MSLKLFAFAATMLVAATAMAQTAPVDVKNAWARATPGKAENGAAYLTVVSPTGDRLTAVSTPVAGKAELHEMKMENGIMKMRPLAGIDLPAGKPVTLKPGGVHVMLLGLKEPLRQGQSFPLTLHLAKGGTREVTVAVEQVGAMGPAGAASPAGPMPMPLPTPAHR